MSSYQHRQIILASGSPRRRELLGIIGFSFTQLSLDIDESVLPDETPATYTLRVSQAKAFAASKIVNPNSIVLTADTTVADGGVILGKPNDADEALVMLRQLRNHPHQVYTAITVLDVATGQLAQDLAVTDVVMRNYSDDEITDYILSGDPMDKAGSYAIQNRAFNPVARIEGCYANVVGLPLCHLVRMLRQFEIVSQVDIASICQRENEIECPVYDKILNGQSEY
jgi:MAF protein